jgi:hypothetical protein
MMQVGTDGYCHTMVLWPANALSTLLDRARPGDTVVLPTGDLAGAAGVIAVPGLRLTSPGPGAVLHADGRNAEGKAILVVRAPGVRIENIGFRGARVPAGNGAGIRFEAGSLVLDRCSFLDNEMGLLTAGRPDMALAVHHCVFGDAPRHDSGQLHHLLYELRSFARWMQQFEPATEVPDDTIFGRLPERQAPTAPGTLFGSPVAACACPARSASWLSRTAASIAAGAATC